MSHTDKGKQDGWSKAEGKWKRIRRRKVRAKADNQLRHHYMPEEHWRVEWFDFPDYFW